MSDRLQELQRQRALIQEQLAWLDREIAAASGQPAGPAAPPTPVVPPAPVATAAASPVVAPETVPLAAPLPPGHDLDPEVAAAADSILERYRVAPAALNTDVKKGCYVYFFAALGLFALGVVVLYFALRHD